MGMYDLSGGYQSEPGLTATPDTGPSYNLGTTTTPADPGLNPGGYDIGGGLGGGLTNPNLGYSAPTDYGLAAQWNLNGAAYGDTGAGVGLQATPTNPGDPSLGRSATDTQFSQKDEPGFWGSRAQKAMSFFANMNPVTAGINAVASAYNSPTPVQAGLQALLGRFGLGGNLAGTALGAVNSSNPVGYIGGNVGMLGAGMVGGALAGSSGAQGLQGLMSGALQQGASQSASIGPYGSGSPMAAGQASGALGGGPQGSVGGGGRDWTDTLMSLASGAYGMYQSNAQRNLATQAAEPSRAAGVEMQRVMSGDFTNDAGFKAAQLAAARAGSQQPGGFAASAAAQAALKYQNDRISTLAGASGSNRGYYDALTGMNSANNLAGSSLASMGFGAASGSANPPWLQQYLIQHGMNGG